MARWLRRGLGLAFKLALVLGISFLGLELMLLAFNDLIFRDSPNLYDKDLGFKTRPGFDWRGHATNAFGFNDRDYPLERSPGTYRVLIVGDSYNWAGTYETNYVELVERRLAETFGPGKVEVINVGYPGQQTDQELATLEKYGLQYKPDLVLLGFFVGNDLYDAIPGQRYVAFGPGYAVVNADEGREWTLFGQPLLPQSRLKMLLETRQRAREWNEAQARAEAASTPAAVAAAAGEGPAASPGPPPPYALTDQYAAIMRARMQVVDPAFRAELEPRKDYAFKHLDKMKDRMQALGIDFGVLIYPDEFQVDVGLRQSLLDREGIDAAGYDWELPQSLVAAWCDKHAVAYHDLLPIFRQRQDAGQRLYLLNDSHWNEAGNVLAAEEIAAWIEPRARAFLEGSE